MNTLITTFISNFDIFDQPITLKLDNRYSYKTALGGFSSLVLVSLILTFFLQTILEFIQMERISARSTQRFEISPGLIQLSALNFMIAIKLEQDDFTISPYFNVTLTQFIQRNYPNGEKLIESYLIDLVPCTIQHFSNYNNNTQDQFEFYKLNDWLCPNLKSVIEMQGTEGDLIYKYAEYQVTSCQEVDPQQILSWKPRCKTQNEINQVFKAVGKFKFKAITTNYIFDLEKTKDYKTKYLSDDLHFTFAPNRTFENVDIFFKDYYIQTDTSILGPEQIDTETISLREQGDFREQADYLTDQDVFSTFFLKRSQFSVDVFRTYDKLSELLSQLGGFMQSLFTVAGVFVVFYNKQCFMLDLASKLYKFKEVDENSAPNTPHKEETFRQDEYLISEEPRGKYPLNKRPKQSPQGYRNDLKPILPISKTEDIRQNYSSRIIPRYEQQQLESTNQHKENQKEKEQSQIIVMENSVEIPVDVIKIHLNNPLKNGIQDQNYNGINCKPLQPITEQNIIKNNKRKSNFFGPLALSELNQLPASKRSLYMQDKQPYSIFCQVKQHLLQNTQMGVTFRYYLYQLCCGRFFGNDNCKLLDRALEQVSADLDVCRILRRTKEIHKLKKVLFNKNQRTLFNFSEKPSIQIKENYYKTIDIFEKFDSNSDNVDIDLWLEYRELLRVYQSTLDMIYNPKYKDHKRVNKRLINLLGQNIKALFQQKVNPMQKH